MQNCIVSTMFCCKKKNAHKAGKMPSAYVKTKKFGDPATVFQSMFQYLSAKYWNIDWKTVTGSPNFLVFAWI